jgi:flagellar biosynthesis protein FliP
MLNLLKIKEIWKKYSVRLSDWMLKEIREEDFDLFWKRLAENIYSKKSLNDEGKVFLAAFFFFFFDDSFAFWF